MLWPPPGPHTRSHTQVTPSRFLILPEVSERWVPTCLSLELLILPFSSKCPLEVSTTWFQERTAFSMLRGSLVPAPLATSDTPLRRPPPSNPTHHPAHKPAAPNSQHSSDLCTHHVHLLGKALPSFQKEATRTALPRSFRGSPPSRPPPAPFFLSAHSALGFSSPQPCGGRPENAGRAPLVPLSQSPARCDPDTYPIPSSRGSGSVAP